MFLLQPSEWHYLNEGNANIVFAYVGEPRHGLDVCTVARINKCALRDSLTALHRAQPHHRSVEDVDPTNSHDHNPHGLDMDAAHAALIAAVLGVEFIEATRLALFDTASVLALVRACHTERPTSRVSEHELPTSSTVPPPGCQLRVSLQRDLTRASDGSAQLTVELKPKWSHCPVNVMELVGRRVCRYCQHQHWKRAQRQITLVSDFCPLQLFARHDPAHVKHALHALHACPQNNWRVFYHPGSSGVQKEKHGAHALQLVEGDTEFLSAFVAMLHSPSLSTSASASCLWLDYLCALICSDAGGGLGAALARLDRIQRATGTLPLCTIKSIHQRLKTLVGADAAIEAMLWTQQPHAAMMEDIHAALEQHEAGSANTFSIASLTAHECAARLRLFLISHSLKDCSVLVGITARGAVCVRVVDCDRKRSTSIPQYCVLEQQIAYAFRLSVPEGTASATARPCEYLCSTNHRINGRGVTSVEDGEVEQ